MTKPVNFIIGLLIFIVAYMSVFTVSETELAVKFKLGEIIKTDYVPGIYFQIPFVNRVQKFDKRIQTLDEAPERFLTAEKKNLMVDSFVTWRIEDVAKFYNATGGGNLENAKDRMKPFIKDGLRDEFAKRNLEDVISKQRVEIMQSIQNVANQKADELGVEIVDVRIKKVDFPEDVSDRVFERMRTERLRVANELRSQGREQSEKIKAEADKQATVILAEAYRDAEIIRGEGDAKAANLYAKAYQKDKSFFKFYRSLQAYQETFADESDIMILSPESNFFDYFDQIDNK